jgi:hypothetical protein
MVVMGKWLLKNLKLTTRIKNKTWTNPQIKNQKRAMNQSTDMTQKFRTHVLTFLPLLTPYVEKTANLHGFKSIYKPRNINVVFSQCGT